jgi:hypothetical protein
VGSRASKSKEQVLALNSNYQRCHSEKLGDEESAFALVVAAADRKIFAADEQKQILRWRSG